MYLLGCRLMANVIDISPHLLPDGYRRSLFHFSAG